MSEVTIHGRVPVCLSPDKIRDIVESVFHVIRRRTDRVGMGVVFISEIEMKKLNRRWRFKNRPTDVLSFSSENFFSQRKGGISTRGQTVEAGDVVIAPSFVRREASRRKIAYAEELTRVLAHGVLHLLGYDHRTEREEAHMFGLQERIVEMCEQDV